MARGALLLVLALTAAVVLAVTAQMYPGCRTDADCQASGDTGAYCKPNNYCHCDAPVYNNTFGGLCQKIMCQSDSDCKSSGDSTASCDVSSGMCSCDAPFQPAPTPAFCNLVTCTSDAMCQADGDSGAYCKEDGNCRCDPPFMNIPTTAFCNLRKF